MFSATVSKMKILLFCICTIVLLNFVNSAEMTEAQFQSAYKLIKDVCQRKTKVTAEQIEAIHRGQFDQERAIMCYTECSLRMMKTFKNGVFAYEESIALAATLPSARQETTIAALEAIKDFVPKSADKCESAYEFYQLSFVNTRTPADFICP